MTLGWEIDSHGPQSTNLIACLEAAAMAPSIHNSQPWRFVVIEDRDTIETVARISGETGVLAAAPQGAVQQGTEGR